MRMYKNQWRKCADNHSQQHTALGWEETASSTWISSDEVHREWKIILEWAGVYQERPWKTGWRTEFYLVDYWEAETVLNWGHNKLPHSSSDVLNRSFYRREKWDIFLRANLLLLSFILVARYCHHKMHFLRYPFMLPKASVLHIDPL